MRQICLLLTLAACGCTATGTLRAPQVVAQYDSIEDRTLLTSTPSMLRNHGLGGAPAVFLEAAAVCPGDVTQVTGPPCASPRYFLGFNRSGDNLSTTDAATIRIGEMRLRPAPMVSQAQTGGLSRFNEVVAYELSADEFRAFVTAPDGEVEARVMGETLAIPARRRVSAAMLLERMGGR